MTETSLGNITAFHLCYFAIISSHSTCSKTANHPGTKLVDEAFELLKENEKFPRPLCAHVLHKSSILVISRCFAEDGKEMY